MLYGPEGQELIEASSTAIEARTIKQLTRSIAFHIPRVLQAELGPQLTDYMINQWAPAVGKALLYGVLHSLVHSVSSSLSQHLAQAVTQGVTHSITHALTHYYYCIYCYESGEFCRFCEYYQALQIRSKKMPGMDSRLDRDEQKLH